MSDPGSIVILVMGGLCLATTLVFSCMHRHWRRVKRALMLIAREEGLELLLPSEQDEAARILQEFLPGVCASLVVAYACGRIYGSSQSRVREDGTSESALGRQRAEALRLPQLDLVASSKAIDFCAFVFALPVSRTDLNNRMRTAVTFVIKGSQCRTSVGLFSANLLDCNDLASVSGFCTASPVQASRLPFCLAFMGFNEPICPLQYDRYAECHNLTVPLVMHLRVPPFASALIRARLHAAPVNALPVLIELHCLGVMEQGASAAEPSGREAVFDFGLPSLIPGCRWPIL